MSFFFNALEKLEGPSLTEEILKRIPELSGQTRLKLIPQSIWKSDFHFLFQAEEEVIVVSVCRESWSEEIYQEFLRSLTSFNDLFRLPLRGYLFFKEGMSDIPKGFHVEGSIRIFFYDSTQNGESEQGLSVREIKSESRVLSAEYDSPVALMNSDEGFMASSFFSRARLSKDEISDLIDLSFRLRD